MSEQSFISKYAVVQRLGTGGMAEVFKCKLSGVGGFEKIVVIKRMLPHLMEDENFISMFLDEARIAANLTHPNIVQVTEIAQDDEGTPFIVMEYVRGPTLSQLIRKASKARDLHPVHMARLIAGAALGLDYAHNAKGPGGQLLNIVHRDVSPQNIMVSLDGTAKILDFGVAKAEGRLTHTRSGVVKGKLRFMAPEQIADPNGMLDRRADVFALGVCLYVATTGKLPFTAENEVEVMRLITEGAYKRPSQTIPGYPPELELIIDKAIKANRDERTSTCREFSDQLTEWLKTVDGPPPEATVAWINQLIPEADTESFSSASTSGLSRITGFGQKTGAGGTQSRRSALLQMPQGTGSHLAFAPQEAPPPAGDEVAVDLTGVVDFMPQAQPPPKSLLPLFAGLGALGVCVVAAAVVYASTRPPPAPPPLPPPVAPVAVPVAPRIEGIKPYIDEGQRLLQSGKLARAKEQFERARKRGQITVEEDVLLSTLEGDLHTALWLEAAAHAVEEGKLDDARKHLQQVEEDDPTNARAKELRALIATKVLEAAPAPAPLPPTNGKAAPPPVRPSALSVVSVPEGASVYVDGDPYGTTPLAGVTLRPGAHLIEVRKKGLLPGSQNVTAAGKPIALRFSLAEAVDKRPPPPPPPPPIEEVSQKLKVTSAVRAQLSLDGAPAGFTPFETGSLKVGKHTVIASAEGFQSETREFELKEGETRAIAFELPKAPVAKVVEPQTSPAPTPPVAAPVKVAPQVPDLPKSAQTRTVQEIVVLCKKVEAEAATKGGLAPAQVRGTTSTLGGELVKTVGPTESIELFPVGMYWFVVKAAQSGKAPQQIAKELRTAHFNGDLANLGP